jgi:hypothetical protein
MGGLSISVVFLGLFLQEFNCPSRSFIFFVKFTPMYLISFLRLLSMELFPYILSQFVHCCCKKKANDFCRLILYPATLPWLFMMYKTFWIEFFRSLRYQILSSANKAILKVFYIFVFLLFLLLP